jgi:Tol biopolymer transport system component
MMKKMNIRLALLSSLVFLAACSESKRAAISFSDKPVTQPSLFAPGVISTTDNNEFDLCFTPDGRTAYFTRRKGEEKQKIYRTVFQDGTWSSPQLASFSTDRDETPFITPDGQRLYFGSEREIPGKPNLGGFDMNVWKVEKKGDTWGAPEPLPAPVNYVQEEGENWPSSNNNFLFTPDGKTHYFSIMNRGDIGINLYKTELVDGEFTPPQTIEGLFENDSLWKYSASISPDGQFLVFNSFEAPGGAGGEDLYVSRKTKEGWSKAVSMGNMINGPGEESSGRFSPDGRYFFFTHADNLGNYEYGPWSIYFVETAYLKLDSLFD